WLKGEVDLPGLALKPGAFYDEQGITLRLGCRAQSLDLQTRQLTLGDGSALGYDELILAPGATARTLPIPGADFANVLTLRNLADAEKLRTILTPGKRLVIIGGGYIGLETAATARARGAEAVVIERTSRVLERVASTAIADFLQSRHETQGVRFFVGAELLAIESEDGKLASTVVLGDGSRLPCDAILVGVGAIPETGLAQAAGLVCDDGILVDENCRTSAPHVYAIGDAAKRPHALYGRALRIESVPNAMEQAKRVAARLTGHPSTQEEAPWFWSDQYDLKLQIAGLAFDPDRTVTRGDPATSRFAVFRLRGGHVQTVEAINSPAEFFAGKKLIGMDTAVDADKLADPAVPLKSLVA
ncbi:MAG: FAD-dependent oxidoreductase, partial [Novosphingobium sp.]|nr:FAD-dependent oxidoreductase [Novosphingobium sp.]